MSEELILTPDELFYLGLLLDGEYIDYSYFAILGDYESNPDSYVDDIKNSLIDKLILTEGFDGSLDVDEEIISLVGPLFYGAFESTLDVVNSNGDSSVSYKYHFAGDYITKVTFLDDNSMKFTRVTREEIEADLNILRDVELKEETSEFSEDKVVKTVILKNQLVEKFSFEDVIFCCENGFFMANKAEEIVNIGLEKAINIGTRVLLGKE